MPSVARLSLRVEPPAPSPDSCSTPSKSSSTPGSALLRADSNTPSEHSSGRIVSWTEVKKCKLCYLGHINSCWQPTSFMACLLKIIVVLALPHANRCLHLYMSQHDRVFYVTTGKKGLGSLRLKGTRMPLFVPEHRKTKSLSSEWVHWPVVGFLLFAAATEILVFVLTPHVEYQPGRDNFM